MNNNEGNKGWGRIMNMILIEGEYKMKYIRNYEKIKGYLLYIIGIERLTNQGRIPFLFQTSNHIGIDADLIHNRKRQTTESKLQKPEKVFKSASNDFDWKK